MVQRSAAWFGLRHLRLTASSFAAAAGKDDLRHPANVMYEMLNPADRRPGARAGAAMAYGQALEPHVLRAYAAQRPQARAADCLPCGLRVARGSKCRPRSLPSWMIVLVQSSSKLRSKIALNAYLFHLI